MREGFGGDTQWQTFPPFGRFAVLRQEAEPYNITEKRTQFKRQMKRLTHRKRTQRLGLSAMATPRAELHAEIWI